MINADGFGVGWYCESIEDPCVYTCTQPAANNRNLKRLADHVHSPLIFAHLRAASENSPVTETNCHPFLFGKILWMHNGSVPRWCSLKKVLIAYMAQECYAMVEGTTDSEHFGALFVDCLPDKNPNTDHSIDELRKAMLKTICIITSALVSQGGDSELHYSSLNFAVTDGKVVIATRFRNHETQDPPSLYYTAASDYSCVDGEVTLTPCCQENQQCNAIIIASEPLTFSRKCWKLVPKNHMLIVTQENKLVTEPIVSNSNCQCFENWKKQYNMQPSQVSLVAM